MEAPGILLKTPGTGEAKGEVLCPARMHTNAISQQEVRQAPGFLLPACVVRPNQQDHRHAHCIPGSRGLGRKTTSATAVPKSETSIAQQAQQAKVCITGNVIHELATTSAWQEQLRLLLCPFCQMTEKKPGGMLGKYT
ncbi:hypothetical protein NDU88_012466 [Pleurodeles waltl]|uniref:Uncharacterized protein n=1 Tax=Pleurodeles waltl TaxID=8319 RepID=A0AAV7R3X6_PLEWA|nr:hypothetical protein NDU88_012466 [Pleurodeles waltl]